MTRRHFTVPAHRASRKAPESRSAPVYRPLFLLAAALCAAFAAGPAIARGGGGGEPLREVMAAEFAVSSGRLDEAVDWYLQAARAAPGDATLAARA